MVENKFELTHLSYSSISSFLLCPASWKYHYIDKVPTKTGTALVFGSAFHNAIENFFLEKAKNEKTKTLVQFWQAAWKEETHIKVGDDKPVLRNDIDWGQDTPEKLENDGVKMFSHGDIISGIMGIAPLVSDGVPVLETKVELRVPGVPIPIIGYIDIITKDEIPADFKTSSRAWSDDRAADELQTLFYLAALNQAGTVVPDWAFTHYVFVKTKTPQFQKFTHKHNPKQLVWLFKLIQNVWGAINSGYFPENPTSWKCSEKWCDFWSICRGKYQ